MNPNLVTPLAGVVQLTTDVPTRVTLHVSNGAEGWAVVFPDYRTDHAVPVLGLQPDRTYTVEVTVTDEAGRSLILTPALEAVTAAVPADFPRIELLRSDPRRMEPGLTLIERLSREAGFTDPTYTLIVDDGGQVVWSGAIGRIATTRLANGNLLFIESGSLVESDLLGNTIRRTPLADPGLGTHHELYPTEQGTFLSLTQDTVIVEDYPTSTTNPTAPTQTANVRDNPVVEFDSNGALIGFWPLTELLDPTRIGYRSLISNPLGLDWAHANAVVHDPRDDSIVASVRHQDAVVKFSRATGDLKWILGPHCNWTEEFQPFLLQPSGTPFAWQFGQHSPRYTPSGTLLLYDNGNSRACPFDGTHPLSGGQTYSRAVEYRIDETAMTVSQVWEYPTPADTRISSVAKGDADWLPSTGNVLITHGVVIFTDGVASSDQGLGATHGRITEVTHTTPAETVFDMRIFDPRPPAPPLNRERGIELYRSERIPSLYPSTVSVVHAPGLTVASRSNQRRRGQLASYVVKVTNPTSTTQCFDYWADLTLPDGSIAPKAGEFVGPVPFCVDPFSTSSRTLFERVPTQAPLGSYTYNAYVGVYPVVLTEANGPFYVAP
jgi:arylsulfate sulfotransferase